MKFFEDRNSAIMSPTTAQKQVLCMIASAPTPESAAVNISKGPKLVTARDMLAKIGLIKINSNEAALTEQGKQIMINQNLMDETGSLTPEGQKYGYVKTNESLFQQINKRSN